MTVSERNLIDVEYSETDDGIRSYFVTIESICTSATDTPRTVLNDLLAYFPPYTPFPDDVWCFARRPKTIKRRAVEKKRNVWRSVIEYTNRPLEYDQEQEKNDPLGWPIKVSGSFVRATRAAMVDRNGDPITNSALEPELPAPEVDDSRDTLIVECNTATIDLAVRAGMRDKVNDATHWGLGKRCIKLAQWAYSLEYYKAGTYYVSHKFEFEINLAKWDFVRFDMGLRELIGTDGDNKPIYRTLIDEVDQPIREPVFIKEGTLLLQGEDPVELRSEILDEADFNDLPLPNPLF